MSSKKESIIEKINDLVTKIGQGIDAMEDMDADAYELNECKELFGDAMEYVNRILNED
jgi:predicted oxidoreductase